MTHSAPEAGASKSEAVPRRGVGGWLVFYRAYVIIGAFLYLHTRLTNAFMSANGGNLDAALVNAVVIVIVVSMLISTLWLYGRPWVRWTHFSIHLSLIGFFLLANAYNSLHRAEATILIVLVLPWLLYWFFSRRVKQTYGDKDYRVERRRLGGLLIGIRTLALVVYVAYLMTLPLLMNKLAFSMVFGGGDSAINSIQAYVLLAALLVIPFLIVPKKKLVLPAKAYAALGTVAVVAIVGITWQRYLPDSDAEYSEDAAGGQCFVEMVPARNVPDGLCVDYRDEARTEKMSEANFVDGKPDGLRTEWNYLGDKERETPYVNGQINGIVLSWYPLRDEHRPSRTEQHYFDDQPHGPYREYYANGEPASESNYVHGKVDGVRTEWHSNGQKSVEAHAVDGVRVGTWMYWYRNGAKSTQRSYENGVLHGTMVDWYMNGQIKSETKYVNGEEVSSRYWDEGGTEIQ